MNLAKVRLPLARKMVRGKIATMEKASCIYSRLSFCHPTTFSIASLYIKNKNLFTEPRSRQFDCRENLIDVICSRNKTVGREFQKRLAPKENLILAINSDYISRADLALKLINDLEGKYRWNKSFLVDTDSNIRVLVGSPCWQYTSIHISLYTLLFRYVLNSNPNCNTINQMFNSILKSSSKTPDSMFLKEVLREDKDIIPTVMQYKTTLLNAFLSSKVTTDNLGPDGINTCGIIASRFAKEKPLNGAYKEIWEEEIPEDSKNMIKKLAKLIKKKDMNAKERVSL